MIIRRKVGLRLITNSFSVSSSSSTCGLMFFHGLNVRWTMMRMVLLVAVVGCQCTAAASSAGANADLLELNLPSAAGHGAFLAPLSQQQQHRLPIAGQFALPKDHQLLGKKPAALAVAIGVKNIVFPPCPSQVAQSVKDQLGIAKFWNLWNISDVQASSLFASSANNKSIDEATYPCTVFAVSDAGFEKQPGLYSRLAENPFAATEFVASHILARLVNLQPKDKVQATLKSVGGLSLKPVYKDGDLFINDTKVTTSEVKLPSRGLLYVVADPLCCTSAEVIPLSAAINASNPNLDIASFVFDRPSISYLRKGHIVPTTNYTVAARRLTLARESSPSGNGTGITRYVYRSPASIWGVGGPAGAGSPNDSIYQALPGLSGTTFLTLLQLADCKTSLKGGDPLTVFMPTDEALASLPPRDIQSLLSNPEKLRQTLLYHIAPGTFTSDDLNTNVSITTVEGNPLRIDSYGNTTVKTVDRAKVILSDIIGHNGVIHIIDRFLYPVPNGTLLQVCQNIPSIGNFLTLLKRANLTNYLTGEEPYTIFAPTDDALKSLTTSIPSTPEGDEKLRVILLNHIVPGVVYTASWAPAQTLPTVGKHTIYLQYQPNESGGFSLLPNGATVTRSDLGATNGVLHIINELMPIDYVQAPAPRRTFWKDIWSTVLELFGKEKEVPTAPPMEEIPKDDIVSTLKKLPNAKDALDAFNITNKLDMLRGEGPFTVFVPVNSAFEKLKRPFSEISAENPTLADDVLNNHIVPQRLFCEELKKLKSVTSLGKVPLLISPSNVGCAKIEDSDILYWNITAKNGIIHLIDRIVKAEELLPEELLPTTEAEVFTTTEIELTTEELVITTEVSIPTTTEIETETPTTVTVSPSVTEEVTPSITSEVSPTTTEVATPTTSEGQVPVTTEVSREETPTTAAVTEESTSLSTAAQVETEATPEGEIMTTAAASSVAPEEVTASTAEGETTAVTPTGREIVYPTQERPVVYLPENVSDTVTPRPGINFTVVLPAAKTLVDVLRELNLTTFPNLLNLTGLDETLPKEGPLTIFAPTDAAFNKVDIPTMDKLFNNPEQLRRVLQYHCVPSPIRGADLPRVVQAITLAGVPVFITVYLIKGTPTPLVNNATVSPVQHQINDTIIYLIDMVLISPPEADIYSTVANTLRQQTITHHVTKAGLDPLLTGPGPITVFVPTDEAWSKLPEAVQQQLASNETALKDYILSHIVAGAVFTPVMTEGSTFRTVNGKTLTVTHANGYIQINNAIIIQPDIVAINGVIHVIDMVFPVDELPQEGVLVTPATVATPTAVTREATSEVPTSEATTAEITSEGPITEVGVTEITSAVPVTEVSVTEITSEISVTETGITEVTSEIPATEVGITQVSSAAPVTEVGRTEAASEIPTTEVGVKEVTSSETPVTETGITELTSELPTSETGVTEEVTVASTTEILLENATTLYPVTEPELPELIAALRNQGLTTLADLLESIHTSKILNLYGLFTLFAPTNKAFEALLPEELGKLKSDPQALQQMLLYNVINRILPFADITDNLKIPSIQGTNLTFHIYDDGRIKTVLGSQIVEPDIEVQNGLIHVIDKLLYPIPRQPLLHVVDTDFPSFSAAVNNTQNRPTLQDKDVTVFVPAEAFWARLPQPLRESILSNTTLMNDLVKDHVCPGRIFKVGIRDGFSCTSLSGKTLNFTVEDDSYYVQLVPIIIFDIIDTDGVIHVIDYPLFLEIPGYEKEITGLLPPKPTRPPPSRITEAPVAASTSAAPEATTEETTATAITEIATEFTGETEATTEFTKHTTAEGITTAREPKELNLTEPVSEFPTVTEELTTAAVTEHTGITETTPYGPEITEETTTSTASPFPERVTKTETPAEFTEITSPEATTSEHPGITEGTTELPTEFVTTVEPTGVPVVTETPTEYPGASTPEFPVTFETTVVPESTTPLYTAPPNATIPDILQQQFKDAGFPIEVSELRPHLPDNTLFTAFIPYSIYLSGLPTLFLEDLAKNNTAVGDAFANHICPGATYSPDFKDGFSCTSLGRKPIHVTVRDGKYYCNGFPIVQLDIPALDGVVHLISGLLFFEPYDITPSPEVTPRVPPEVTATTSPMTPAVTLPTEVASTERPEITESTTTEIEEYTVVANATPPIGAQVTEEGETSTPALEFTTVGREPKELNLTEPTTAGPVTEVTTELPVVSETTEGAATIPEEITTTTENVTLETTSYPGITEEITLAPAIETTPRPLVTELTTRPAEGTTEYVTETSSTREPKFLNETEAPTFPEVVTTEQPTTAVLNETAATTESGTTEEQATTEVTVTTTPTEYITVAPNDTIASITRQQFKDAGHPIDITVLPPLPDTHLYTAFVPYSVFLSGVPIEILQSILNNNTVATNTYVNHICQDATYSREFANGFQCTSLGGKLITVTVENGRYFCNGFVIIQVDIPALDGVVHLINGLLFFESEGVTPAVTPTSTETVTGLPSVAPTTGTTEVPLVTEISPLLTSTEEILVPKVTEISTEEGTTPTEVTEHTTLTVATREPKELNLTEAYPPSTEEVPASTLHPEFTLSTVGVTEESAITEGITTATVSATPGPEVNVTTGRAEIPERTTSVAEETTTFSVTGETGVPTVTEEISVTATGFTTAVPLVTEEVTETTTPQVPEVAVENTTSKTIPSIFGEQFRDAGYPINVTEVESHLPDTFFYTACIPYSAFLSELPTNIMLDLTRNTTATNNVLLNHICRDATYSRQFNNGYTCISLGGRPLVITVQQGRYYCNNFPIVRPDIPAANGVVHFTTNIQLLEPSPVTTAPPVATEITPEATTTEEVTEEGTTEETTAATITAETVVSVTEEEGTTAHEVTEHTTLVTATREPKVLNISEATEEHPATTGTSTPTEITSETAEATAATPATPEVTPTEPAATSAVPVSPTEEVTEHTVSEPTGTPSIFTPEVTEVTPVTVGPTVSEEVTTGTPSHTEIPEITTVPVSTVAPNETIPSIIEQQFQLAGYPIDTEGLRPKLPDTHRYTACVPYSAFLAELPHIFLQELTRNATALDDALLNHICQDVTFSRQFGDHYTCTSLGGAPLTIINRNGQYYCNNFPIIEVDIPTLDGVVHIISGLLSFEHEGITPPPIIEVATAGSTEAPATASTELTTATEEEVTGVEITTSPTSPAVVNVTEAAETTTLITATREPKVLNLTEAPVSPEVTEVSTPATTEGVSVTAAETTEVTRVSEEATEPPSTSPSEATISTEQVTATTEAAERTTGTTSVPEVTGPEYTEVTEVTTASPATTEGIGVTATAETTAREVTEETTSPTESTEISTPPVSTPSPNTTIPSFIQQQFENAGYPIDVTELQQHLPEIHRYTACVPYSTFLSGLQHQLLQDLTSNATATTNALLNHICQGLVPSSQFRDGYTCISLGGRPIILSTQHGQYYCNDFPIIRVDIPTVDGLVHIIDGLLFFEADGVTPPIPELLTTLPATVSAITTPGPTTVSGVTGTELEANVTEPEITVSTTGVGEAEETTPAVATEVTTLVTATREPKVLNVSEPTETTVPSITEETTATAEFTTVTEAATATPSVSPGVTEEVVTTEYPEVTEETTAHPAVTEVAGITSTVPEYLTTEETLVPTEYTAESTPLPEHTTSSVTTEEAAPETTGMTTEFEVTRETTAVPEHTTVQVVTPAPNQTIPSIIEKEFEAAGYPINVTDLQSKLPDTFLYTAFVPYSVYISGLPIQFIEDLTRNPTAITNALLNHICRDATYSPEFAHGFTCPSIGGRLITVTVQNGQHYCNGFPIIRLDIPALDGVVHLIDGLLFEGVTPAVTTTGLPSVTSTIATAVEETTTGVTEGVTVAETTSVTNVTEVETTSPEATEFTTLVTATREPKVLNLTEPTVEHPETTETAISTEHPEVTISTEIAEGTTAGLPITEGVTETTVSAEVTEVTKVTAETATPTEFVQETTTITSTPSAVTEITTSEAEVTFETTTTTPEIITVAPNDTIPSVFEQQFEKAGYPIDTTELQQHMPDIQLYTACIPYSTYLQTLPTQLLQDLTTNRTATTNALLDHVCPGASFISQSANGFTCTSLGGKPITVTRLNGHYFCNDFPVIRVEIPTIDGVIYIIDGLLFFGPGVTPAITEIAPTTVPSVTGNETVGTTIAEVTPTEPEATTEITTLLTVTREPKVLNLTEVPEIASTTQEAATITTEFPGETVSTEKFPEVAVSTEHTTVPVTSEETSVTPTVAEGVTSATTEVPIAVTTEYPGETTEATTVSPAVTAANATTEPGQTEGTTISTEYVTSTPRKFPEETGATTTEVTETPLYTTTEEVTAETTTTVPEHTTPTISIYPNQTIPSIFGQQFEDAGYPIDTTDIKPHLPEVHRYTACVPYSIYLLGLRSTLLQQLTTNKTATTDALLNHICQGEIRSPQFQTPFTCTTLGGSPITLKTLGGQYYCNDFPIVKADVPTADGIVHIISGLLFFESEGVTPPPIPESTTATFPTTVASLTPTGTTLPAEITTATINVTEIEVTGPVTEEVTSPSTEEATVPVTEEETTRHEVTEHTTLTIATREPKELNFTEPAGTTEVTTAEFTTSAANVTAPTVTEETTTSVEHTTGRPEVTEETASTPAEESTATPLYASTPEIPSETTLAPEYSTPTIIIPPNETIPAIFEKQFEEAGHPIDTTDLKTQLPETYRYTACIPYSTYLSRLPDGILQELTANETTTTNALLNHICQGPAYSPQFRYGFTCSSLGGTLIVLSFRNGRYYCNDFPVIKSDVRTRDGVVHIIDGLMFFEGVTPPAVPELATTSPTTVPSVAPTGTTFREEITTGEPTVTEHEAATSPETRVTEEGETTPYEVTEYSTTLVVATREPKLLNLTESTGVTEEVTTPTLEYTTSPAYTTVSGVTTAEVTLPTEYTPITELTELTPTETTSPEAPAVTGSTTSPEYVTEEVTITTEHPTISTEVGVPEVTTSRYIEELNETRVSEGVTTPEATTEVTEVVTAEATELTALVPTSTLHPEVTAETTVVPTEFTTEIPEVTGETTAQTPEITTVTTVEISTYAPNETIPSVLAGEFQQTGYPIDVSELRPRLPDRYLYTAFLPYRTFLRGLPTSVLQDLARNKTAIGDLFANHICPEVTYSSEFGNGFSCVAIGGRPIVVTVQNGKYYTNGIPIIRVNITAADGVIHLIDGLLFFEFPTPAPEVSTTGRVEESTPSVEVTSPTGVPVATSTPAAATEEATTSPISATEVTTEFEGFTSILNVTMPIEAQVTGKYETTTYEATEHTTLIIATREPKELNISEPTEAYTTAPEETTTSAEFTETVPTVPEVTAVTSATERTEATEGTTVSVASTEAPAFTTEHPGVTEEVSTPEFEITTALPTRPPRLLNETETPTEFAVTEETTASPEVRENVTISLAEHTTEEAATTSPVTEVTGVPSTVETTEESTEVSENVTGPFETATPSVTGAPAETTSTEATAATEISEISTTTAELPTSKYPELFGVTTAVTEYTSPAEEITTSLYSTTVAYPAANETTTIPFYPYEPRGVLSVSIFFFLVDMSGVDDTLSSGGPYTILAPVDAAFHALPTQILTQLKEDVPFLREVLLYHIIPERVPAADLHNDFLLTTLQGQDVRCNVYGPVITLGGAKVIMPDSTSGYDGVLHIMNRVLYPVPVGTVLDTIAPRNDTDKVQNLIKNTTLPARLKGPGPFTVFLPSDRALNSLPSYVMDILEHNATLLEEFILSHMVNGTYYTAGMTEGLELTSLGGQVLRISLAGGLTVNGVPIVSPDISVTNGVVHIIDKILYDPSQELFIPKTTPVVQKDLNVVQLMKQLNLTTFSNLLADSGLSVNLSQPGFFTVFAPTNDAFAAMPPNQLDTIKADHLRLVQILLYHILPVQIETSQMTNEMVIPSLLPTKSVRLNIYVNNRGPWYTASGSQILRPNNLASNGVVHIVHQVLYIPLGDIVQTVEKCSILQTLRHIIKVAGLEDQLRGGNYTLLAPNDAAFNKLPEDTLDRILVDPHLARLFILGHLLRGTINTEGIFDESTLVTSSNNSLYVRALKDCILLNSAAIQYPDVTADNGVVHVIDRVL